MPKRITLKDTSGFVRTKIKDRICKCGHSEKDHHISNLKTLDRECAYCDCHKFEVAKVLFV